MNNLDVTSEERSTLLSSAQKATEDAILLNPKSKSSVLFSAHYNLGQIYNYQSQDLRKENPIEAQRLLMKAAEQFKIVTDHDPKDADAKVRFESCQAAVTGAPLVAQVREELKALPKNASEDVKSHEIVKFVTGKDGNTAKNINAFLQASVTY